MNIYKIGNKVSCIIRFYSSPAEENRYGITEDKQPYTIINTANATLSFEDRNVNSKNNFNQLSYNNSKLSTISFSDIPLNDRIIKLIFNEDEEEKYFSIAENYSSDEEGSIYLNSPTDSIYNVYIYDNTQSLLMSIEGESSKVIGGLSPNENYLICYQYKSNIGYNLDKPENRYFTLDIIVDGKIESDTSSQNKKQYYNIHIEKCALRIDKNMYFDRNTNAVDLEFTVINDKDAYNYIALA